GQVAGSFTLAWMAYRTESSGRLESVLSPGIDDSNLLGMQLATGLVFAGFMFVAETGWLRWGSFAAIPFILNAIILTASRSAFLGVLAAGSVALSMTPRPYRRLVHAAVALGTILFFILAHDDLFWTRIDTIASAGADPADLSATSRMHLAAA